MELSVITGDNIDKFEILMDGDTVDRLLDNDGTAAIGAVIDGTAGGVLVYTNDGVFVNIDYLSVSNIFRRQGVATALVDFLCKSADKEVIPVIADFYTDENGTEDDRYS